MLRLTLVYLVIAPALARCGVVAALVLGLAHPSSLVASAAVGLMYAIPLTWVLCRNQAFGTPREDHSLLS